MPCRKPSIALSTVALPVITITGNAPPGGCAGRMLQQVESAAVGQVQVDQHDVGDEARQRRAGFGERGRGVDGKAVGGEDGGQAGQAIGIVFDNQGVWHGGHNVLKWSVIRSRPGVRITGELAARVPWPGTRLHAPVRLGRVVAASVFCVLRFSFRFEPLLRFYVQVVVHRLHARDASSNGDCLWICTSEFTNPDNNTAPR